MNAPGAIYFIVSTNNIIENCSMKALVLGGGGREQALAWKIAQSERIEEVLVAPGNGGRFPKTRNVTCDATDAAAVAELIRREEAALLVVGPEQPLAAGLVDSLMEQEDLGDLAIVGPRRAAAELEWSKDFAKAFMTRHDVPTAPFRAFSKAERTEAEAFVRKQAEDGPVVLKADGLAAGKGVLICRDVEEALCGLEEMWGGRFGSAADRVLVEGFLTGIECSVFVLTDGIHYHLLPTAKDYKRIGEGDTGLNTGGMGAVSPVPFADGDFMAKVRERIIEPTMAGLQEEGLDYRGFLYFGLMNHEGDPYVIEYNCRMGDPETQAVMPRIKGDLVPSLLALRDQTLDRVEPLDECAETAVTVVAAAKGYPEEYAKDKQVILYTQDSEQSVLFHSGTRRDEEGNLYTAGGRVFAITALGKGIMRTRRIAYEQMLQTCFDDIYYRKDIGKDLFDWE